MASINLFGFTPMDDETRATPEAQWINNALHEMVRRLDDDCPGDGTAMLPWLDLDDPTDVDDA